MESLDRYQRAVFFTGAGISAESGVPTYRGSGGIWGRYDWRQVACQEAFERDPQAVLDFHEQRRALVAACTPNAAHEHLAAWQARHSGITVITQNTDGLHARAGSREVIELHGSLWRLRCVEHGVFDTEVASAYPFRRCPHCGRSLRPDITWFHDPVDEACFNAAGRAVLGAELFVAIGTSGVVWPAAGLIELARRNNSRMIEINPEPTEASLHFDFCLRDSATRALPTHFPLPAVGGDHDN